MRRLLLFLVFVACSICCYSQREVPTPPGSVLQSLRNDDKSKIYPGNVSGGIRLDDINNMHGDYWKFYFVGSVPGIGDIDIKPFIYENGWAQSVALNGGCGYIGYYNDGSRSMYARFYVVRMLTSKTDEIIGANILFQAPYSTSKERVESDKKALAQAKEQLASRIFWNDAEVPDKNLRKVLLKWCDKDKDGIISEKEVVKSTGLWIQSDTIESWKGIENLKYLKYFDSRDSYISGDMTLSLPLLTEFTLRDNKYKIGTVDLSKCKNLSFCLIEGAQLKELNIAGNTSLNSVSLNARIDKINLSGCTRLSNIEYLFAVKLLDISNCIGLKSFRLHGEECKVEVIDATNCYNLEDINLFGYNIASIKLTNCTALKRAQLHRNALTSIDLSGCPALSDLSVGNNKLIELNLSNNVNLTSISCDGNQLINLKLPVSRNLSSLYCSDNKLNNLSLSGYKELKELGCSGNFLVSLDLSGCNNLTYISCSDNRLNNLKLPTSKSLTYLSCGNNKLLNLDLAQSKGLEELRCEENLFTSLDLSPCDSLHTLKCEGNKNLTRLDITHNKNLYIISCNETAIKELDISQCKKTEWENIEFDGGLGLVSLPWSSYGFKTLWVNKNQKIYFSADEDDFTREKGEYVLMKDVDKRAFALPRWDLVTEKRIPPTKNDLNFNVKVRN